MKFVHTSDWHLGRMLHGVSLLEDQRELLGRFLEQMEARKPDAIIIAGDVYDRAVPPKDAVALLDQTLVRLVLELKIPTLVIAGNHDSPQRLAFGSRVLEAAGLYMEGPVSAEPRVVTLGEGSAAVDVALIPFASPELTRSVLEDPDIRTHEDALAALCQRALRNCEEGRPKIAVSHAFVTGGEESESERMLSVGGSGAVPASVFEGFDYVALGHLHRPQRIDYGGHAHIRYSGSLLKYSFSEVDHAKGYSLVELRPHEGQVEGQVDGQLEIQLGGQVGGRAEGQAIVNVEHVPLSGRRDLRVLEGSLRELIDAGADDPKREDYVLARVSDKGRLFDAMARLREGYPNAMHIERPTVAAGAGSPRTKLDLEKHSTLELFRLFFEEMTAGEALTEAQEQVVRQAVAHVSKAEVET